MDSSNKALLAGLLAAACAVAGAFYAQRVINENNARTSAQQAAVPAAAPAPSPAQ